MLNRSVWDDGNWRSLPSLESDIEADVCVIGLGGSGLSCILELVELNQRVVGLDAGMIAGGAAGRNGGFLLAGLAAFYHEAITALGHERAKAIYALTVSHIQKIISEAPQLCKQTGSLRIASSEKELADCEAQYDALKKDGFDVEHYEGQEGKGLYFATDAVFNPLLRCRTLAKKAMQEGVQLFEHSKVIKLNQNLVETKEARVHCKHIIVAIDGKLELLLPELSAEVRTSRLQMLATEALPDIIFPKPVYLRWGYEYYQQLANGSVALGGFRDKAEAEEWTFESEPSKAIQARLTEFLRRDLKLSAKVTHRWAASVSYSKTVLPYFAQVRPYVWAIGAYNGTGNVLGAVCGRAVAQQAILGKSELAALFLGP